MVPDLKVPQHQLTPYQIARLPPHRLLIHLITHHILSLNKIKTIEYGKNQSLLLSIGTLQLSFFYEKDILSKSLPLHLRLFALKNASLFLRPITDDQAPGYSLAIKKPMDLSTIRRNIDLGVIKYVD